MKAIVFNEHGGPEVLHYSEVSDPSARPGEIVVNVHAASINGADDKIRSGGGIYQALFPHILGRDFSGVVRAVGPGVSNIAVGDAVFGVLDQGKDGAYAEKLVTRAELVIKKPDWLSHVEAAAVALTGITAVWSLEDTARLQAGETVLIHGAAGGVGTFAVQFARHLGARVIGTASSANQHYVQELGAHQVIDYSAEDFRLVAPLCDVVFDTVGGETQVLSYDVLKPSGRLVWIASAPPGFVPQRKDVRAKRPDVRRDRAHLRRVLDLLKVGAVSPPTVRTFALRDAAEAHRVAAMRHLKGKLVLTTSLEGEHLEV